MGGRHLYIDCGMFQGTRQTQALNDAPLPIPPAQTDAIVITHGHIDHVGYLPKIVHDGYRGPIYCTPATAGLIEIVLEDAAHLQQHLTHRGFQHELHAPPPFYNDADVQATLKLLHTVPLETDFDVCGAAMRYHNAAHILGSAFVDAHDRRPAGDLLGRPRPLRPAAAVRSHAARDGRRRRLRDDLRRPPPPARPARRLREDPARRHRARRAIVIPAFAVERTQDILYSIGVLQARHPELARTPVHVDSPMAIKVDALFARYPEAHKPFIDTPNQPFGCSDVTLHVTTDESKQLNDLTGPAIIIAASGMASGGRILHHLHNHIPDPTATIVFAGFQGPGTLGNILVHGAPTVRIFGDTLAVRATIVNPSGYSAHADQAELLRWLGTLTTKPHLYAVHGEPAAAAVFATVVAQKLGFTASVAERGTTVTL